MWDSFFFFPPLAIGTALAGVGLLRRQYRDKQFEKQNLKERNTSRETYLNGQYKSDIEVSFMSGDRNNSKFIADAQRALHSYDPLAVQDMLRTNKFTCEFVTKVGETISIKDTSIVDIEKIMASEYHG